MVKLRNKHIGGISTPWFGDETHRLEFKTPENGRLVQRLALTKRTSLRSVTMFDVIGHHHGLNIEKQKRSLKWVDHSSRSVIPLPHLCFSPRPTTCSAYALWLATIAREPRNAFVNNLQRFPSLGRRRQVLVPVLGNQDAILDAHAADVPVLVQHLGVDVLSVIGVGEEEGLDVGAVEVTRVERLVWLTTERREG